MTLPDDLIDPAEARLMRSVRTYSDAAVVPIDPVAIAAAAATTARVGGQRRSGVFGRFATRLVLAGATAAITVAALATVLGPGAEPTASPPTAAASSAITAYGLPSDACRINVLGASISTWDGAAGSRIAHVALTNYGQTACAIPSVVQVNLMGTQFEATERNPLITGATITQWSWVRIGAGQVVSTLVDASNYCGPTVVDAAWIDFIFPLSQHIESTPASDPSSDDGVPPCNGPGQPGHIEMQPWAVTTGGGLPQVSVPPPDAGAERTCTYEDVDAVITNWSGAAGSRVATVELHQLGPNACFVNSHPQVHLVGIIGSTVTDMISGEPESGSPIDFRPGGLLYTQVDVSNYCGPDPEAPVTVEFGRGRSTWEAAGVDINGYTATALSMTDLSGVPPCNGPNQPGHIEMHEWSTRAP